MLSTRVRTLPRWTAAHAWWTALFSPATVEGGHPCLGSWLTFDPKHAQLGSCLDSPWQHLIPQDLDVPMLVHGSINHNQLTPPPWWIAPHTMIDGPRFPSLGWTQASISLSPCLRRTVTRPSLWHRKNRDSSLKIQCLHCLRSHTLCLLPTYGGIACALKWA